MVSVGRFCLAAGHSAMTTLNNILLIM